MLSGHEIRTARALLGWGRAILGRNTVLSEALVAAIESSDGPAWLTDEQEATIRCTLKAAGVEFTSENGEETGVRLRKSQT